MISVLTVNYHSASDLQGLANSLRRFPVAEEIELIVTNNSPEETIELASDEKLSIRILSAPNVGYAAGINRAYQEARGEILFIVNPDVRVIGETLNRASAFLRQDTSVGLLLPMLRYPHGEVQRSVRRFYTWPVVLFARSPLRAVGLRPPFFRHYLCETISMTQPTDVDWGLGGAMFLRRADCEANGVFDERYFLYFEDVDLCHRIWSHGRRVVYDPRIECIHAHRRHSGNPLSTAGWRHFQSLVRFVMKHKGLPDRPR